MVTRIEDLNFRPYKADEEKDEPLPQDTGQFQLQDTNFKPYYGKATTEKKPILSEPQQQDVSTLRHIGSQVFRGFGSILADMPRGVAIARAPKKQILDFMDLADQGQVDRPSARYGSDPDSLLMQRDYLSATPEQRQQLRSRVDTARRQVTQSTLYEIGDTLDEAVKKASPVDAGLNDSFWKTTVPQAFGSGLGFLAVTLASRGLLGRGALSVYGAPAGAGMASHGASEFREALQSGADIDTAYAAAAAASKVGITEAIPIATLLTRTDRATGGAIKRALIRMIEQGTEEAIQESGSEILRNLISQKYYDPERKLFTMETAESGAAGFTTGVLMEFLVGLLPGRVRSAPIRTPEKEEPPELTDIKQRIRQRLDELDAEPEQYVEAEGPTVNRDLPVVDVEALQDEQPPVTHIPEEERERVTETEEFKDWFGDSKVVDENGEPRVVYHGTKREFETFKATRSEDGLIFFTLDPDFASTWPIGTGGLREVPPDAVPFVEQARQRERELFDEALAGRDVAALSIQELDELYNTVSARMRNETGYKRAGQYEERAGLRVLPVYLSVQKLFDPRKHHGQIEAFLRRTVGANVIDAGYHKNGNWVVYERRDVIDELKSLGYDGLLLTETIGGEHDTIAVFRPEQIKSAVGNRGTFSSASPDITAHIAEQPAGGVVVNPASVRDSHAGEMFADKTVEVDGEVKASADISILDDEVAIKHIEVAEDARRQRLATQLVEDLFQEFPDKKIRVFGGLTEAGSAFFRQRFDVAEDGTLSRRQVAKQEDVDWPTVETRGVQGDELLNAQDLATDLLEKNAEITPDGMVTLYHRTTPENAQRIVDGQQMVGREDRLFFGTRPTGQIEGYGDAAIRVRLPVERLELNDVFRDEAHVTLMSGRPGTAVPIEAAMVEPDFPVSRETPTAPAEATPRGRTLGPHLAATSPENVLPEPTEAQREAGTYKMGRQRIQGLEISVENPAGSERTGVDPGGKRWRTKLKDHYGYIRGTVGADGDHLDVITQKGIKAYVESGAKAAEKAYVVNQRTPDGKRFDELKIVLGPTSLEEAKEVYLRNFERGWGGMGRVIEMPMETFKKWLDQGDQTKPVTRAIVDRLEGRKPRKKVTKKAAPKRVSQREQRARNASELRRRQEKHASALRAGVQSVIPRAPHLPEIGIAASPSQLPDHLQSVASQKPDANGLFDGKTQSIWLIGDRISDRDYAVEIALHEIVGHYGLRQVLRVNYADEMDKIWKAFPDRVRQIARKHRLDVKNYSDRLAAAEEVVAYMAQKELLGRKVTLKERSVLNRIIDAIKRWLSSVGLAEKPYTEKDILKLIQRAAGYVFDSGGYRTDKAFRMNGMRRHEMPPPFYSGLYRALLDPKNVPESSTIGHYLKTIKKMASSGKIKQTELDWIDLEDAIGHRYFGLDRESVIQNKNLYPKQAQVAIDKAVHASAAIQRERRTATDEYVKDIAGRALSAGIVGDRLTGPPLFESLYDAWRDVGKALAKVDVSKLRITKDMLLDIVRANEVEISVQQPTGGTTGSTGEGLLFDGETEDNPDGRLEANYEWAAESAAEAFNEDELDRRVEDAMDNAVADNWDQNELDNLYEEKYQAATEEGLFGEELRLAKEDAMEQAKEEYETELRDALYSEVYSETKQEYEKELEKEAIEAVEEDAGAYWRDGDYRIELPYAEADGFTVYALRGNVAHDLSFDEAVEWAREQEGQLDEDFDEDGRPPERTRWASYTIPGGKHYAERVFIWNSTNGRHQIGNASIHWPEDYNVIVHTRFDERETPEGDKAVFVDEIQSDWHQFNREEKKGEEAKQRKLEREKARLPELRSELQKAESDARAQAKKLLQRVDEPWLAIALIEQATKNGVPLEEALQLSPKEIVDKVSPHDVNQAIISIYGSDAVGTFAAFKYSPTFRDLFANQIDRSADDIEISISDDIIRTLADRHTQPQLISDTLNDRYGIDIQLGPYLDVAWNARRRSWTEWLGDRVRAGLLSESEYEQISNKVTSELASFAEVVEQTGEAHEHWRSRKLEVSEAEENINTAQTPTNIVPAPFENDWPVLTTKWQVQEAVRQGYKTMYFAPGMMHSQRWGGGTGVLSVSYRNARALFEGAENPKEFLDQAAVFGHDTGKGIPSEEVLDDYLFIIAGGYGGFVHKTKVKDVIGYAPAQHVLKTVSDTPHALVSNVHGSGQSTKLERESKGESATMIDEPIWFPNGNPGSRAVRIHMGSLKLYDEVNINRINKFLKKYKARLRPAEMPFEHDAVDVGLEPVKGKQNMVHMFRLDITPQLEEAAKTTGFPLFHVGDIQDDANQMNGIMNGEMWDMDEDSRPWNYAVNKFQVYFQDRLGDVRRAQRAIEEKFDTRIPDDMDVILREEMMHSRLKSQVDGYMRTYVEPLVKMIRESGYSWDDVEMYGYARHAPEANNQVAKINKDDRYNSGMTNEEAAEIMALLKEQGDISKLSEIADLIDKMVKLHQDTLVSEGLEKQETIDAWRAVYDYYVPLKGHASHNDAMNLLPPRGKGFDTGGPASKRRLGRRSRATSILANIVAAQQVAYVRAEKARVGRALLALATKYPNPKIWSVDKIERKRYFDKRTGLVQERILDPRGVPWKTPDNVLIVKVNGDEHAIAFNDKNESARRMAMAFKNLTSQELGVVMRTLHSFTRILSALSTSVNPEFWVTNFPRDLQTAFINLAGTDARGAKRRIFANLRPGSGIYKGIYQGIKGKADSPWAKEFLHYQRVGGQVGWIDNYKNIEDLDKKLRRMLDAMDRPFLSWNTLMTVIDEVENINIVIENGVRLSAFKEARELGMSDERAASLAKNLTVNFNRRGLYGPFMNALYMFSNASIQGAAVIVKTARNKTARRLMYGVVAFGVLWDMAMRMWGGDDDDGVARYDRIPNYIKERNLVMMVPPWMQPEDAQSLDDYYTTWPLPYGYNVLHVLGNKIGQYLDYQVVGNRKKVDPMEDAVDILSAIANSFIPIGSEASIVQTLSPTVVDPFVQVIENKAWYGGPLMPETDPFDSAPPPDSQRYFNSASEPAKVLAREMNRLSGGSEQRPGLIDISPETIDHFRDFTTGGLGRFIGNAGEMVTHALEPEEIELEQIPFARRFVGRTDEREVRQLFYDRREEINYADNDLAAATENGDTARIAALWRRYQTELSMRAQLRSTQSQIRRLRTLRRAAESNETLPDDTRQQLMDQYTEQMDRRMFEFNRQYQLIEDQINRKQPLIERLGPFIIGKSRDDAADSLRGAGLTSTAELLASLPKKPRKPAAKELAKELG